MAMHFVRARQRWLGWSDGGGSTCDGLVGTLVGHFCQFNTGVPLDAILILLLS